MRPTAIFHLDPTKKQEYIKKKREFIDTVAKNYGINVTIKEVNTLFDHHVLFRIINDELIKRYKGKYTDVCDSLRDAPLVIYRQIFTKICMDNGLTIRAISRLLDKNSASVHYYKKRTQDDMDIKSSEFLSKYNHILFKFQQYTKARILEDELIPK
jgi:hypothetical protein